MASRKGNCLEPYDTDPATCPLTFPLREQHRTGVYGNEEKYPGCPNVQNTAKCTRCKAMLRDVLSAAVLLQTLSRTVAWDNDLLFFPLEYCSTRSQTRPARRLECERACCNDSWNSAVPSDATRIPSRISDASTGDCPCLAYVLIFGFRKSRWTDILSQLLYHHWHCTDHRRCLAVSTSFDKP